MGGSPAPFLPSALPTAEAFIFRFSRETDSALFRAKPVAVARSGAPRTNQRNRQGAAGLFDVRLGSRVENLGLQTHAVFG